MDILKLKIADIDMGHRLRAVDDQKVRELTTSMYEHGLMTPIEVRPAGAEGKYDLVYGAHRLSAALELDWDEIDATIFDGTRDQARLREIDENLYRAELTPYDQAQFLAERRAIYERLNGRVKQGRAKKGKQGQNVPNSESVSEQLSFFDETTSRFGLNRKTIIRALSRRHRIVDAAWAMLRGTKFGQKGSDLDVIGKLEPEVQLEVCKRLAGGSANSVSAAVRMVSGGRPVTEEKSIASKIISLWARASAQDRQEVLDHLSETGALEG